MLLTHEEFPKAPSIIKAEASSSSLKQENLLNVNALDSFKSLKPTLIEIHLPWISKVNGERP